ncbi:MAG: cofactor-independent phosphoglycerate mutase [Nitrospirae bacterium]|nr:cofactor-independent phosphoglycerate mutase [Nitrospirota bacterium]
MKYVLVVADGMPDEPIASLGGRTPLETVATPTLDRLAGLGTIGVTHPIPDGFPAGSDIGNLSLMGYDPAVYFTGRSPLEVIDMGVELRPGDVAFRMNLITMSGLPDRPQIEDYSAGHIGDADAAGIVDEIARELRSPGLEFIKGVSYRHALVWHGGPQKLTTTPPHDIQGVPVADRWPQGEGADRLTALIRRSWDVLAASRINLERAARGEKPANSIWFWGQGTRPALSSFAARFRLRGAVISAVPLLRGMAVCAGLEVLRVPGMTGWLDTNYAGKVRFALDFLRDGGDFVLLHVEAIDEAGHVGDLEKKLLAIEHFDGRVMAPLSEGLASLGPHRLLVTSDHLTYLSRKTHVAGPVPFIAGDSSRATDGTSRKFCEKNAALGVVAKPAHELLPRVISGDLFR